MIMTNTDYVPNKEVTEITNFTFDDIKIKNYQSHKALKGSVAV